MDINAINFLLLFSLSLSLFSSPPNQISPFSLLSPCLSSPDQISLSSLPWLLSLLSPMLVSLLSHGHFSSKTPPLTQLQKPMASSLVKRHSPPLLTIATYSGGFFLSLSHYGYFSHGSWVIFQIGFMGFGF